MVGAGSVVTRDVPPYGLVYGNAARLHGFVCPCGAKLEQGQRTTEHVIAQCPQCGRQILIPTSDWEAVR
jgi:acyl-[acyl carrier protein]--UDP-N-acetylglucosamine O-acyltransferase